MNFVNVIYQSGYSRFRNEAVDWMLAMVELDSENIELYAEKVNHTWDASKDCYLDETATYDDLKEEIISQAASHRIDVGVLKFPYDDSL